jgi:hypothetical protein
MNSDDHAPRLGISPTDGVRKFQPHAVETARVLARQAAR